MILLYDKNYNNLQFNYAIIFIKLITISKLIELNEYIKMKLMYFFDILNFQVTCVCCM